METNLSCSIECNSHCKNWIGNLSKTSENGPPKCCAIALLCSTIMRSSNLIDSHNVLNPGSMSRNYSRGREKKLSKARNGNMGIRSNITSLPIWFGGIHLLSKARWRCATENYYLSPFIIQFILIRSRTRYFSLEILKFIYFIWFLNYDELSLFLSTLMLYFSVKINRKFAF